MRIGDFAEINKPKPNLAYTQDYIHTDIETKFVASAHSVLVRRTEPINTEDKR